jgi:hypothetical protein
LPMPGSPSSTSAAGPESVRSTKARTAASSCSLPTISRAIPASIVTETPTKTSSTPVRRIHVSARSGGRAMSPQRWLATDELVRPVALPSSRRLIRRSSRGVCRLKKPLPGRVLRISPPLATQTTLHPAQIPQEGAGGPRVPSVFPT